MTPGGAPCGRAMFNTAHSGISRANPPQALGSRRRAATTEGRNARLTSFGPVRVVRRLAGRVLADAETPAAVDLDVSALLAVGRRGLALDPVDLARVDDRGVRVAVEPGAVRRGGAAHPREPVGAGGDVGRREDRAGCLELVEDRQQLVVVQLGARVDLDA